MLLQHEAFQWRAVGRVQKAFQLQGGILGDCVGYGKTAITLGLLDVARRRRPLSNDSCGDLSSALLASLRQSNPRFGPDESRGTMGAGGKEVPGGERARRGAPGSPLNTLKTRGQ
eukprot:6462386-Amphidinium_carterae.1